MSQSLIQFPSRETHVRLASGPAMYMRYEAGGAVRRYDLPEYIGPPSYRSSGAASGRNVAVSQQHALRIAEEVEQTVAQNPRLRSFNPAKPPSPLQTKLQLAPYLTVPARCYGAGLFLVHGGAAKLSASVAISYRQKLSVMRLPAVTPSALRPDVLLASMGRVFASAVRTLLGQ